MSALEALRESAALAEVEHVLLRGVSWAAYERLLDELEGRRRFRLTYDRGVLEIMSPRKDHERYKTLIGRLIETYTEVRNIPVQSAGSTTWKSELKARGIEPDECYYIQNEPRVRGDMTGDLATTPPPDLAVEVDITKNWLDRKAVYAALGIPEVWSFDGKKLVVWALRKNGRYAKRARSRALPGLLPREVEKQLRAAAGRDETSWIRAFRRSLGPESVAGQ